MHGLPTETAMYLDALAPRAPAPLSPGWWYSQTPGEAWQHIGGLEAWWRKRFLREGQRVMRIDEPAAYRWVGMIV